MKLIKSLLICCPILLICCLTLTLPSFASSTETVDSVPKPVLPAIIDFAEDIIKFESLSKKYQTIVYLECCLTELRREKSLYASTCKDWHSCWKDEMDSFVWLNRNETVTTMGEKKLKILKQAQEDQQRTKEWQRNHRHLTLNHVMQKR